MKLLILFFIASIRVTPEQQTQATELARITGKKVVFRNAKLARQTAQESPEKCEGVTGDVPEQYLAKFPLYSLDGKIVSQPTGTEGGEAPVVAPKRNSLGIIKGGPDSRKSLVKALEDAKVSFHPKAKTEDLVALYISAIEAPAAAAFAEGEKGPETTTPGAEGTTTAPTTGTDGGEPIGTTTAPTE